MLFCADFEFKQMSHFFQWYVSGFTGVKVRAYTTCHQYISAWHDHCDAHGFAFPAKGSPTIRRINKFIKALGGQFPHMPRQDLPLTLSILSRVASHCGIFCVADLWTVHPERLTRWARCLVARSLLLRGVEHKFGARRGDVAHKGTFYECTVGARERESKYKGSPRVLPIERGAPCHTLPVSTARSATFPLPTRNHTGAKLFCP